MNYEAVEEYAGPGLKFIDRLYEANKDNYRTNCHFPYGFLC